MKILLKTADETMLFGKILAEKMIKCGIHSLYLFAPLGGGKTTLTRGVVSALKHSENAEVSSPSFTLYNLYNTIPQVAHADFYRLEKESAVPEELEEILEDSNTIFIAEWAENLRCDQFEKNRVEVFFNIPSNELDFFQKKDNNIRFVSLKAEGMHSECFMREILQVLRDNFSPLDT